MKSDKGEFDCATVATSSSHICGKSNLSAEKFFMNPMSPGNRHGLDTESKSSGRDGRRAPTKSYQSQRADDHRGKQELSKGDHRAAMAKPRQQTIRNENFMLLNSGTTPHMNPISNRLFDNEDCDIPSSLVDDSTVQAT